jgi:uncharacterized protein (PEP-CTERM system associated)
MAAILANTALVTNVAAQDAAGVVDTRDFSITPKLGVQESFTDNALLTAANRQADAVTRLNASALVLVDTGRTKANIDTAFSYDQYASNGKLSGWSLYGNGNGSYSIVPGALALEAEGTVTNGTVSTFGTTAVDRAGTIGRVQLATYDVGPRFTTTLGDFADLNLLGRFAQVLYNAEDTSNIALLPADSSIVEFAGTAGTGGRFLGYELTTNANYQQDNHDFRLYNVMQSAFVRVMPAVRLIARGGYEDISQPGVVNVTAPIATGGVEISINRLSKITVEGGTRYKRPTWDASVYLQFSDRIYVTGRYFEILAPAQIQLNSNFSNFVSTSRLLPMPATFDNVGYGGNLYDQTSLNKTAEAHIVYHWEDDSVDLEASWNDRSFIATGNHDRVAVANASYYRRIAPDLAAEVRLSYAQTFASPIYGASSSYGAEINLSYDLNSRMTAKAGIATNQQVQTLPLHESLSENVLFASIERRF